MLSFSDFLNEFTSYKNLKKSDIEYFNSVNPNLDSNDSMVMLKDIDYILSLNITHYNFRDLAKMDKQKLLDIIIQIHSGYGY